MQNLNDPRELEKTKIKLLQNLSLIEHAPSVQMQQVPPDFYLLDDKLSAEQDRADPDVRMSLAARDKHVEKKGEFFDGDEDQDTSKQVNNIVNNKDHVMTGSISAAMEEGEEE
jgi:histone deacetylase 1/2